MKNDRFFERGELGPGPRARWMGSGFGPPPFGPHGPRGRRRRGDVRVALLMLLALESPLNGYQLMQGLEERSDGRWRPSPGSVYPALAQLEDEGLIQSVQPEGETGRAFELTDVGRDHLAQRGEQKPPWEPSQDDDGNPRVAMRNGIVGIGRAAWNVAQDGTAEHVEEALKILEEARRKLYRLLAGD